MRRGGRIMSWENERVYDLTDLKGRRSSRDSNFASCLKPFASRLKIGAIVAIAIATPFDPVSDTS